MIHTGKGLSLNSGGFAALVATQGTIGGVSAVLHEGKFGNGFAAAGVTKLFAPVTAGMDGWKVNDISVQQTAVAAIIGGTSSEITGGKFANGAITGAMVNLYNQQDVLMSRQAAAAQYAKNLPGNLMIEVGEPKINIGISAGGWGAAGVDGNDLTSGSFISFDGSGLPVDGGPFTSVGTSGMQSTAGGGVFTRS